MGQYGAYGYAQHGWTYDRIIKHYYTGTTIGQAPVSRVRVLLVDSAKQVTISSKLPFQVVDGAGSKHAPERGSLTVGPGYKYTDPTNLQAKPTVLPVPARVQGGCDGAGAERAGLPAVPCASSSFQRRRFGSSTSSISISTSAASFPPRCRRVGPRKH
jgi:hypothetical protein